MARSFVPVNVRERNRCQLCCPTYVAIACLWMLMVGGSAAYPVCPLGSVSYLSASIEMNLVNLTTGAAPPTMVSDSFVMHFETSSGNMRIDLMTAPSGLASVYGSAVTGGIADHAYQHETKTCTTGDASQSIAASVRRALNVRALLLKASDVAETSLSSVLQYRGLGVQSATMSVGTYVPRDSNPALFTGFSASYYFIPPNDDRVSFVAPGGCSHIRYINLVNTERNVYANITIAWLGMNAVGSDAVAMPSECNDSPTAAPPTSTAASGTQLAMPTLPAEYSSRILTTEAESGNSFYMSASFSAAARAARVEVIVPVPDVVGRATKYAWHIAGSEQTAYYYEQHAIPSGTTSQVEQDIREYFWPNVELCERAIFTTDLVSGSVAGLLLVSGAPTYMGETVVRGIHAQWWQSTNGSLITEWYWGDATWQFDRYPTASADADARVLLRITVRGTGQSPLFVHHPFYQQGRVVPEDVKDAACRSLFPQSEAQCAGGFTPSTMFFHTHDFISFVPMMPSADIALPTRCQHPTFIETFGEIGCSASDVSGGVIAVVIFALILAFSCGMCCQWCRMTPQLRDVEEELQEAVKTMHEYQAKVAAHEATFAQRSVAEANGDTADATPPQQMA